MPLLPKSKPVTAPQQRPRARVLTDLTAARADLTKLPPTDVRRSALRGRIDRLLDELIDLSRQ